MQFLKINKDTTLTELTNIVGSRNVDTILNGNSVKRTKNVGKAFEKVCQQVLHPVDSSGQILTTPNVTKQRKMALLDKFTDDSDLFEIASMQSEQGWIILSELGAMENMLKVPETVILNDSMNVYGNNTPVPRSTYAKVMHLIQYNQVVDSSVFESYSSVSKNSAIVNSAMGENVLQWFKIPWGDITLYSSLSGESMDFPVYPQGAKDGVTASYDTMPELLYQYEPIQVYKSTGPRANTYTFHMHRDMWTGDHRDGKCNELIRFCEANCYPRYSGAAVNTARVTLFIKGQPLISGIMTSVEWSYDENSPIGLDGFFLEVNLSITIVEVSAQPLNYDVVRQKGMIS